MSRFLRLCAMIAAFLGVAAMVLGKHEQAIFLIANAAFAAAVENWQ